MSESKSKSERKQEIEKLGLIPHSMPFLGTEEIEIVIEAMNQNQLMTGRYCKIFERKFSEYIKVANACATNSGTAALHLALLSLHPEKGDEVILPTYVCYSVLTSAMLSGFRPVLVDITDRSYNISPESIEEGISTKTRAIVIPHMFGEPAEIDEILKIKKKHPEIALVEDCAQSIGAELNGKRVGSFGDISIFSFYATKMITSITGGMVVSDSEERIKSIDEMMETDERENCGAAYPYRMNDISAALGIAQLQKLSSFLKRRAEIAQYYDKTIEKNSIKRRVFNESVNFRYVIEQENRDEFISRMRSLGVTCEKPVYKPLHHYLNLPAKNFPNAEHAQKKAVSVPCYPALTDCEVEKVAKALTNALKGP